MTEDAHSRQNVERLLREAYDPPEPAPAFEARVRARMLAAGCPRPRPRLLWRVAAACFLGLVLGFVLYDSTPPPRSPVSVVAPSKDPDPVEPAPPRPME